MRSEKMIRDIIKLKESELGKYPGSVTEFELKAAIKALRWVLNDPCDPTA